MDSSNKNEVGSRERRGRGRPAKAAGAEQLVKVAVMLTVTEAERVRVMAAESRRSMGAQVAYLAAQTLAREGQA